MRRRESKVVAHLRNHSLIKGHLDHHTIPPPEMLAAVEPPQFPPTFAIREIPSGEEIAIHTESLKALFFVKTFEGRHDYSEMKFFKEPPSSQGLWVAVKYYDDEFSEGVIRNSVHFLQHAGFFLIPPDLESNNKMVYVLRDSLRDFRVLGLRAAS